VNLLLFEPGEINDAGIVTLSDGRARHVRDVLRATPGQQLRIGTIDGPLGTARGAAIEGRSVTLQCTLDRDTPQRPAVDLLLALPRPKVLRRLWAQLAAIGVSRIILTNAERVERNYFDTHVLGPDVYRPLLVEGLQQARDTRLPLVSIHRRFRVLVEDELDTLSDAQTRIVAHPSSDRGMASAVGHDATQRVLLAVGAEGGWNPFELDLLGRAGFTTVGIGRRTLRSDTASIALLAVLHAAMAHSPAAVAPGA
jgi:RsmE family RNA methyltransferase